MDELYFTYDDEDDEGGTEYGSEEDKRPLTAEETLACIAAVYLDYLQDMLASEQSQGPLSEYAEGRKSAYVETLQFIQKWENMQKYGLNFDIESVYRVT